MLDTANFVLSIFGVMLGAIGGGVAVYTGIRSDLARLAAVQAVHTDAIERAHSRIDSLQTRVK